MIQTAVAVVIVTIRQTVEPDRIIRKVFFATIHLEAIDAARDQVLQLPTPPVHGIRMREVQVRVDAARGVVGGVVAVFTRAGH